MELWAKCYPLWWNHHGKPSRCPHCELTMITTGSKLWAFSLTLIVTWLLTHIHVIIFTEKAWRVMNGYWITQPHRPSGWHVNPDWSKISLHNYASFEMEIQRQFSWIMVRHMPAATTHTYTIIKVSSRWAAQIIRHDHSLLTIMVIESSQEAHCDGISGEIHHNEEDNSSQLHHGLWAT